MPPRVTTDMYKEYLHPDVYQEAEDEDEDPELFPCAFWRCKNAPLIKELKVS